VKGRQAALGEWAFTVTADEYQDVPGATIAQPRDTRKRRQSRGRLRCTLGILLFASLLAATRLSQLWLAFDVLNHFTLHFGILAAAFTIGYFMPFGRVLTAFVLALLSFAGIGAYAHYTSEHARILGIVQPGEQVLRLMTFNTRLQSENSEALINEIRRLDPDVATLVEFGENKRVVLNRLKSAYPYSVDCAGVRFCNLVIISKVPILSSEFKGIWRGPPLIRATLGGRLSGLNVIGVHSIRAPHVRAQFSQMSELAEFINQGGKFVIMGDWNATPFSRLLAIFADRTGLRRLTSLPTWPGLVEMPQLAIDHVFVSSDIRLLEEPRIGRRSGSDHYPVAVTVAVPPN
jgi:endonuclease/exonuclease/phosphatase (EEP) superfamily protein YafD